MRYPDGMPNARGPLVLASSSPRRRALLADAGVTFEIVPAEIDETPRPGEEPLAMARRLACGKARAVAERLGPEIDRIVLGADTIVVLDGRSLGKPRDAAEAIDFLTRLGGRQHRVWTAVAALTTRTSALACESVSSEVHMRRAERSEIEDYVATGEAFDKAGGYGAQGEARRFIERIHGSESNVIGLPVRETLALIERMQRHR